MIILILIVEIILMRISTEINDTLLFRLLSIWRWISIIRSCTSYACSLDKLRTSINGTTSNEEIPTAKYSDVTLHKRVSLISSFRYAVKYGRC